MKKQYVWSNYLYLYILLFKLNKFTKNLTLNYFFVHIDTLKFISMSKSKLFFNQ